MQHRMSYADAKLIVESGKIWEQAKPKEKEIMKNERIANDRIMK